MPGDVATGASAPTGLVRLARAGDRVAQRRLFDTWQPGLFRFLRQMVGDDELAAELTQETFVKALGGLRRLRSDEAFEGWLFRIARNLVRDRAARPTVESLETAPEPADPAADPTRPVELAELRERVGRAVAALPPAHREVIVLHHLQGREVEAIARLLRLPEGTVKSRLARGRAALRRALAAYVES